MTMKYAINKHCYTVFMEPAFKLFKHAGLICCVQRNMMFGTLNGYVAIDHGHPLYGKAYGDKIVTADVTSVKFNQNWIGAFCSNAVEVNAGIITLDMFIDVHCGLTSSDPGCPFIDNEIMPDLWWFGFDTAHSGDLHPWGLEFSPNESIDWKEIGYRYRDFNYVEDNTKKLADQLAAMIPQSNKNE